MTSLWAWQVAHMGWAMGRPTSCTCSSEDVVQVEAKYMLLARDLMAFEQDATQHWMQHAHASAEALLRQPVLVEDSHSHRFVSHFCKLVWMYAFADACPSGTADLTVF